MSKHNKHNQPLTLVDILKHNAVYIVLGIVGLGLFGYWWTNRVSVPQSHITRETSQIYEDDWVKGNRDASVILTEYSDFQCPACASYAFMMDELIEERGDSVAIVYRHLPLKQIHPQAVLAASAAEAAGMQGKFWEMHDLIFENQLKWSNNRSARNMFIEYAELLDLDIDQFKSDLNSPKVKSKVEGDYLNALSLRLQGTPSFFLNGERIENPASLDSLIQLIDALMPAESNLEEAEPDQDASE